MLLLKLAAFTRILDSFLRWRDFRDRRTVGGWLDQYCKIRRHTLAALTLPSLLIAFVVMGSPTPYRVLAAVAIALATLPILIVGMRYSDRKNWPIWADLMMQVTLVLLASAAVWILGSSDFQYGGLYKHLLIPLAAALCIALLVASLLVYFMFRRLQERSQYDLYLQDTELFASRGQPPTATWGGLLTSLITVIVRGPLELLTVPAIASLLAPTVWLRPIAGTVFALYFVAIFIAGLNERFSVMWKLLHGFLFRGGSLIVSAIVIALGIARVAGVSYVTTVFDTAAWWAVGVLLLGAYILSWWYEYWSNRLLADQVLAIFQPGIAGIASIPYLIDPAKVATMVPPQDRVLQIHSSSRFVVIGDQAAIKPFFQTYSMSELVERVAAQGAPGGDAVPSPAQIRAHMFDFHVLAGLLFIILVGGSAWHISDGVQEPELEANQSKTDGVSLASLLMNTTRPENRPVIVVAASGGGTRAAVYTASILEGIAKTGRAADIVLGSGVSGGGAALAYFASNYQELIKPNSQPQWDQYFEHMKEPYIRDVILRASQWGTVSSGRLGLLLAKSFKDRWHLDSDRQRLEQITDFGLILNTSIAGRFDRPEKGKNDEPLKYARDTPLKNVEPEYRDQTSSELAGGRLILTNLGLKDIALKPLEPDEKNPLPIIVRGADIRLEDAAALNANFPPVFSNAAIDLDKHTRYWVTDGGAVDNRGLEMVLFAIRSALKDVSPDRLPPLYVVVADASGYSDHFSQDRGVSPAAGAGTHFASHLDAELVSSIESLYKGTDRFHFSYVMMPLRLRASDSFGTHWMLQPHIRVHHLKDYVTISGDEMVRVLRALHGHETNSPLSPEGCQVLVWSREDRAHQAGWLDLIEAFGAADQQPECVLPNGRSAGAISPQQQAKSLSVGPVNNASSLRVGPDPLYPNAVTPGKADTLDADDLTADWECPSGVKLTCTYSQSHRSVSKKTHTKVYDNYNVPAALRNIQAGEVDHLDPVCNGGSNDIQNLWYQPAKNMWKRNNFGYKEKDSLETWTCREVKAGRLDPKVAFEKITSDWVKYYMEVNPKHVKFD